MYNDPTKQTVFFNDECIDIVSIGKREMVYLGTVTRSRPSTPPMAIDVFATTT